MIKAIVEKLNEPSIDDPFETDIAQAGILYLSIETNSDPHLDSKGRTIEIQ